MHIFQRGLIVGLLNAVFILAFVPASQAWIESESVNQPHVRVSLVSESPYLVTGQSARFALKLVPDDGWHTYWKNPGDTGIASKLNWQLPADFRAGDLEWPVPERIDYQGATNFGYHGETWLFSQLAIPPSAKNNDSSPTEITLKAQAQWLLCKEICIPGTADLRLRLPVYHQPPSISEQANKIFDRRTQLLPIFIYSAQASYRIEDFLSISVPLKDLPVIDRPPQVFLGQADVIDNSESPTVSVVGDFLLIRAKVDPYLKDVPSILSVVLSLPSSSKSDAAKAIEFVARQAELPSVVMASLDAMGDLSNGADWLPDNESININIVSALVFALLGGIILNAMPCVFPVLSLKILSLVESGQQSSIIRQQHGLAYAAGVIISFVFIAAVLLALRFFGEQIGWGFQLQSPWFVAFLVYLLFVLGLSLSGFIELGSSLQNVGSSIAGLNEQHWRSSFFTGVLATVVATPCTAPFMGSAMGFALSQPTLIALLVFAVMGLGLALPFLLIAFIPRLAAVLPQPGQWMVTFKELLAFPIYLTVVWLLWVFSRQTNVDAVALLLVGLIMLTVTLWLLRLRQRSSACETSRRFIYGLFLLLSMGLAIGVAIFAAGLDINNAYEGKPASDQQQSIDNSMEEVYDAQKLATALANGEAVFVNMTADWCITCKLNERIALSTDTVKKLFKTESVRYMKGDWTNSDAAITAYLAEFNRNGVPLYVYYAPDTPPVVLPQILTAGIIRNYIMREQ